ncbi:hypothetical protein PCI56_11040 [Plesiomonas shigelloides subsp. oncorhynchi]|nr:hypothetical protein [Plesiomonas shigelloides]
MFAPDADPDPDEILQLMGQRQQLLQRLIPTLSVENKQQLLLETQSLLCLAQTAKQGVVISWLCANAASVGLMRIAKSVRSKLHWNLCSKGEFK